MPADDDLMRAAEDAVGGGRAEGASASVNQAGIGRVADDPRLAALDEFIAGFEAEHGEITADDMADAGRWAAARETRVRGRGSAG